MKKIKTYYAFIIWWPHLLVVLVTCNGYSKSYMIGNPSLEQESLGDHPSSSDPSTFDEVLQKINSLFEKFKECSSYVDQHKASYTLDKIKEIDAQFQAKQNGYAHEELLMLYNSLSLVGVSKIPSDDSLPVMRLKGPPSPSILLPILNYLSCWQKAASKQLKNMLRNPFIRAVNLEDFGQSTKASKIVMVNNTKINLHKVLSKQSVKSKSYTQPHVNTADLEKFTRKISDYLNQDIIPYWASVAQLLIFRLLNNSLAKGKIVIQEAKANYQKALEAIAAIYSPDHIQACKTCLETELKSAMAYKPGKSGYNPIEIFAKLVQCFLKPIDDM
ncbi:MULTISPECIES: hypothetical protein [unclassified Candidatus Cardinium]|uniref:hypothetical protein n=1 Tax=unclassified Candidatus Cardinium TaxID=2641185 RepID=UPI001FB48C56|nr:MULTISPECIES: hypothetical protein [unclassified Candidatus Cardinium]